MAAGKCPYCGGDAERIKARVVRQPSHLAFGYGERRYRCRKCSSEHSVCYAVPPKGSRGDMPKPHPDILKVGFTRSIQGFADPIVLSVRIPGEDESAAAEDGTE